MQILVPDCGVAAADAALRRACALARPGDTVIVMAAVVVPRDLPLDAPAGAIWRRTCRAERALCFARRAVAGWVPAGVGTRFARIHARSAADAILAGVARYRADCILLPAATGLRGALSARFGTVGAVVRRAPCPVRVIRAAHPAMEHPVPASGGLRLVTRHPAPPQEAHHAS